MSGPSQARDRPGHRPNQRAYEGAGHEAAEEGDGAQDGRLHAGAERPFEVAAEARWIATVRWALFAVLAFFGAARRGSNGRLPWGLSALCIVATLVLLPLYFAGVNARMIEGDMGAREVGAELASWRGWQWLRTALAVLAVAFGVLGLGREQAERAPN